MTPERWRRIEEVFQAAYERPAEDRIAFVAGACGDDPSLQREVEALLGAPDALDNFLAQPPFSDAARVAHALAATGFVGQGLGVYRLQSLLGVGGMGEVYRARDEKLGRDVAIKILPPGFVSNGDRAARFEREARTLAALNHRNICAIHGVEEANGVRFLILELVEGQSLDTIIAANRERSGLPVAQALDFGKQIAEALEAAHDKGIVHRDLKPANIKVTADGVVKVLDFSLAKFVDQESGSPTVTQLPTANGDGALPGLLLGTAAYMSPEQARAQPVDKRCDIWAFGCVLFEMLSGRSAFAAHTVSDTVAKILEREPDWRALPAATPDAIRRLLARCLTKNHRQRLRDIGEVRVAIDTLHDERPAGAVVPTTTYSITSRAAFAVILALAAGLFVWQIVSSSSVDPLSGAAIARLTNWEGTEEGAEISPDGRFAAFLADRDGEFDLWLTQIGTGRTTNLTRDIAGLEPLGTIVRKFGFTGDGADLWFSLAGNARLPKQLLPVLGGTARTFLTAGDNAPAWSPTGNRIAYFSNSETDEGRDPIYVAEATGANPRAIVPRHKSLHQHNPVWSLDGRWLYYVAGEEPLDEMNMDIWRVPSSGGTPERLTNQHAAANFLAPIDARTVLYIARDEDWSGPWLWALDVGRRESRRVRWSIDQFTSVAASRDGSRVVATTANPSASLWRVQVTNGVATDSDVEPYQLPLPTGRAFGPRLAGQTLFYLAARGTGDGLWRAQGADAAEVWRDLTGALSEPVAVSADGRMLALAVREEGRRHIRVMAADGTNARTLAPDITVLGAAGQSAVAWSPDRRTLVAGGRDARGAAMFLIPVDGSAPSRLLDGRWANPIWSPDGRLIVYSTPSTAGHVTLLAMRPDGATVAMPSLQVRPGGYRFLPDSKRIVYLPEIQALDFWELDLETMQSRPLTRLGNYGAIRIFDVTADGRHIVFDRVRDNADVVLAQLSSLSSR